MDEFIQEEGKLGQGFTSADALEEVDIGNDSKLRPVFTNASFLKNDFVWCSGTCIADQLSHRLSYKLQQIRKVSPLVQKMQRLKGWWKKFIITMIQELP